MVPYFRISISTRRFCCRPSSVRFEATGRRLPYPTTLMRFASIFPVLIKYSATASARRTDRVSLCASLPVESVCPPILRAFVGYAFRSSTTWFNPPLADSSNYHESTSNRISALSVTRRPSAVCFHGISCRYRRRRRRYCHRSRSFYFRRRSNIDCFRQGWSPRCHKDRQHSK